MKTFLRENPTIVFGLGLPLLLVVLFLLASGVPTLLVAPPQYDVLYATNYYNHPTVVQISVVDQAVQVFYHSNSANIQTPHLWRYSPQSGAIKEIAMILPTNLKGTEPQNNTASHNQAKTLTPVNVQDLEGLKVDSSSIAPDGYEFSVGRNHSSSNVLGGLFYSSRYRHQATLRKNGRTIALPNTTDRYYSGTTRFIGWVIPQ